MVTICKCNPTTPCISQCLQGTAHIVPNELCQILTSKHTRHRPAVSPTDGFVPLGPQSNLRPAYDAPTNSWSLKIASSAAAAKAYARSAQARAATTGGVPTAAAEPSTPLLSARAQAAAVSETKRVVAAGSTCTGCGDAPWYPYECVPCPPGYSVDFYGLTCGEWWVCMCS